GHGVVAINCWRKVKPLYLLAGGLLKSQQLVALAYRLFDQTHQVSTAGYGDGRYVVQKFSGALDVACTQRLLNPPTRTREHNALYDGPGTQKDITFTEH